MTLQYSKETELRERCSHSMHCGATTHTPLPAIRVRQFCDRGRIKTDIGISVKAPGGELSILQLDQEVHFWATVCKKKRSTMKAVCRAFGHSKLAEPLDVQEPSG